MYKCMKCGNKYEFVEIAHSQERRGRDKVPLEEYSELGREKSDVIFWCPNCYGKLFSKVRSGELRTVKAR